MIESIALRQTISRRRFLQAMSGSFLGLMAGTAFAQQVDNSGWVTYHPDVIKNAVKRKNDLLPLSDQNNHKHWVKYEQMSDEFSGDVLDDTKWYPNNPTWQGRQPGWFDPKNVTVQNGCLNLTLRLAEPPEAMRSSGYHTYTSAAVQSKETVLYGYFEIRAKPMASAGSSAFWFYKSDPDRWTEIDVFEIGGGAKGYEKKDSITMHVFHTPSIKSHFQIHDEWAAPVDLDADFHVYGLEWDDKELKFYFDGVLIRKGPNAYWTQPLTMNFDSETMPDWFGLPSAADLPSVYQIDYIRSWKKRI
jgi:beta-glucanase (GH16 family)